MLLPYDTPTAEDDKIASATGSSNSAFADNDTSNRQTLLTLNEGVELTVNGTLSIGAITGSTDDNKPQGQASSNYCELKMGDNSKMIVNGTLNCYGFIKDSDNNSSSIIVNGLVDGTQKSGAIRTPVVFYDFSGGTDAVGYQSNGVFPFSQFDIPQIRSKMVFNYGSNLIGVARIYVKSIKTYTTLEANLLGPSSASESSFISMDADSSVDWQYANESPNGKIDANSSGTSNNFQYHSTSIAVNGSL